MSYLILLAALIGTSVPVNVAATTTNVQIQEKVEEKVLSVEEKIVLEATRRDYSPVKALAIAKCESGLVPTAKSKLSSASGVFQFIRSTWQNTMIEMGQPASTSPFDEDMNIEAGIYLLSKGGEVHWAASRDCWGKVK